MNQTTSVIQPEHKRAYCKIDQFMKLSPINQGLGPNMWKKSY